MLHKLCGLKFKAYILHVLYHILQCIQKYTQAEQRLAEAFKFVTVCP